MTNFYSRLSPINAFLNFSNEAYYTEAPEDWLIVIADIEGSTKAIEAGKYKWVNMAGASSIVALVNALGTRSFPFVFGGDGATALIPEQQRCAVEKYLRAARANAQEAFQLNLRIGLVSHRELMKEGFPVKVARYAMTPELSIAFFRGEGIGLAEKWVKSGRGIIEDGPMEERGKVLQGLSCRWAPLKSSGGLMLSIIVKPRATGTQADATLHRVAEKINSIVDLDSPETHPVKQNAFSPEKIWKAAKAEADLLATHPRWFGILKVMTQMVLARILDRFDIKLKTLDFRKYKASMTSHSDFRKYDEQLRMVIDCSREKAKIVRQYLESEKQTGAIYFGLYESSSALITCFLESFEDGGHIHFVDGNDGGYAIAAKELKSQMRG